MHPCRQFLLVAAMIGLSVSTLVAAVLTDRAAKAYAEYADRARQSFLNRVNQPVGSGDGERASLRKEEVIVSPAGGDGIQTMPDSLIHHWRGAVFIRGVTLDQVVSVSRAYRDYPKIFPPVIAATVLSDESEALRVQFRMKQSAASSTREAAIAAWPRACQR